MSAARRSHPGNLRNLKFKFALAQVLCLGSFPRILIRWELEKTTQNLRNLKFIVLRGESQEEMKPISHEISHDDLYEFVDTGATTLHYNKEYHYQVLAREYRSNAIVQTFDSGLFVNQIGEDLISLYIIEEHEFKYRYVGGAPVLILKNPRAGTYCPDCWDTVLKRPTKSNCITCHGTGKLGGFYTPIPIWMDLNPSPEVTTIPELGEKEVGQTDGELTNYPLLDNRDLIIEALTGKIWRVESIHTAKKWDTVIRQLVRLSQVNRSDIEYKIPLEEEMRKKLVDDFRDIRDEVEF